MICNTKLKFTFLQRLLWGAKYALYENPNPKGDGKKQPLHARIVPRGTIHTQEIAEEIADSCGYSTATTKGMLDALAKVISKNLRYGYTVELDDLGSFSISPEKVAR